MRYYIIFLLLFSCKMNNKIVSNSQNEVEHIVIFEKQKDMLFRRDYVIYNDSIYAENSINYNSLYCYSQNIKNYKNYNSSYWSIKFKKILKQYELLSNKEFPFCNKEIINDKYILYKKTYHTVDVRVIDCEETLNIYEDLLFVDCPYFSNSFILIN